MLRSERTISRIHRHYDGLRLIYCGVWYVREWCRFAPSASIGSGRSFFFIVFFWYKIGSEKEDTNDGNSGGDSCRRLEGEGKSKKCR